MEEEKSIDYMSLSDRKAYEKGFSEGKKIYDVSIHEDLDHIKKNMSTEYASPVINNIPDGGGNDGGLGALAGILPIALLAPLLGLGRGFGRGGEGEGRNFEAVIAEQVGDVRHEIGEAVSSLKSEICDSEKEAIKAGFEARLEAKESKFDLSNKIDCKVGEVEKSVEFMRVDMDKQFCHVERMLDEKFTRLEIAHKNEEIQSLKARIAVQDTVTSILTALGVPSPVVPFAKKV